MNVYSNTCFGLVDVRKGTQIIACINIVSTSLYDK